LHIIRNNTAREPGENMRLKMTSTFGVTLALALSAWASPVSVDTASDLAASWLNHQSGGENCVVRDVLTHRVDDQIGAYTVRFEPAGFVLLPADDAMQPVIGWSLTDTAPAQILHPGLLSLVENLGQEVRRVQSEGLTSAENTLRWDSILAGAFDENEREQVVPPLMTTTWDQGGGWNAYCPVDTAGPAGRVYVGCVATSMVQVMKYWNQPQVGVGSHGYNSNYGYLSVDFSAQTYDWAGMHDSQVTDAAALLSYHAAVAVDMGFAPDGSGAYVGWGNPSAITAMVDHFDYHSMITFEEKSGQSWANWRASLRDELDAGRPMIYRGHGTGGHAFNCDGYTDDDYFHFNWGWSGYYNGWFLVNDLSPGDSDFSEDQGAIMQCQPNHWQRPPFLSAPAEAAPAVACEPAHFAWEAATDAVSYELVVDDAQNFSSPLLELSELTETEYDFDGLAYFTEYFWRVRSSGPYGTGPWSPVRAFTTEYWETTPTPEPVTPMDGAVGVSVSPTVFVWHTVPGAESYHLQVSDLASFETLSFDSLAIPGHFTLVQGLSEETEYFWRLSCDGLSGESEWSVARSLTTRPVTGLDEQVLALAFDLVQNFPNPFNPSTQITWNQSVGQELELSVFDLTGREVAVLASGWHAAGSHSLRFDAAHLPAGLYFARLQGRSQSLVMKMTLLK
jgi:hypothetical protein